jgi:hypothetical protein
MIILFLISPIGDFRSQIANLGRKTDHAIDIGTKEGKTEKATETDAKKLRRNIRMKDK